MSLKILEGADEGGEALKSVGAEPDEIFGNIAEPATSDKSRRRQVTNLAS